MYDINKVREDFPILSRTVYGKPLVYLDNGATTQKPLCVLDAMQEEYLNVNANVHRGVHWMSQQATDLHEAARETVRKFINARSTTEIIFTRGTTESLNLVASSFVEGCMKEGDEVIAQAEEDIKAGLAAEGKPEKIWDKIIPGKMDRFMLDNTKVDQQYTLLAQIYIMDDSKTVEAFLESQGVTIAGFTRFEVGDGIEKAANDFESEVAATMAAALGQN